MKTTFFVLLLMLFSPLVVTAATAADTAVVETAIVLHTNSGDIHGTLTTPAQPATVPAALLIAGSGPTDRDGNNPMMKNNSLKQLALALAQRGIASLRYDKRGIAASKDAGKSEADLRFDDYVNDAKGWVQLLKHDARFSRVCIVGHSEGSLIGMLAADSAEKFISIAGAGQSADKMIKAQLSAQPQAVQDLCFPMLDSLKRGRLVGNVPASLNSLFRPSVQPYMISWFRYDPQIALKKLSIPILIIQGTNDLQVSVSDATRLSQSNPNARMTLIDRMNHVFKIIDGDRQANAASYNDASLPISAELVKNITTFIGRQ